MMNASTTFNPDQNDFLKSGMSLKVRFFQNGDTQKNCELLIRDPFADIKQIGQSYKIKIKGSFPSLENKDILVVNSNKEYFLKIPTPDSTESHENLRNRFERERNRGDEINALADLINKANVDEKTGAIKDFSFKLPKLVQAGVIRIIEDAGKEVAGQFSGLPFVVYEWIDEQADGIQLDRLSSTRLEKIRANWFKFAQGLAQVVRRLHNHGFLHAYIVPRNILYCEKDGRKWFSLAGFGYSSLSIEEASSPREVVSDDKSYQAPEFSTRCLLDALWHPADIYSIGAVLLYLATGNAPQWKYDEDNQSKQIASTSYESPKKISNLKEEIRNRLKNAADVYKDSRNKNKKKLFSVLSNDNVAKIIDNCLRHSPDDRFATVEELLEAIDVAAHTKASKPDKKDGKISLGAFFVAVREQKEVEYDELVKRFQERHHFELYGSRTKIIEGLCRMLARLPKGAIYRTVTLPSYWTSKNLGPDGRFLAMNKYVVRHQKVAIERIFYVGGKCHTLSDDEHIILESQQQAIEEGADLKVRVRIVEKAMVQDFERSGKAVAFIAMNKSHLNDYSVKTSFIDKQNLGQFLCLNFISRGEEKNHYGKKVIEREIKKVRIWDPGRGRVYWEKLQKEAENFRENWDQSFTMTLKDYMNGGGGPSLQQLLKNGKSYLA